jgi:WS/DGAT/MGAT family acyltransferase
MPEQNNAPPDASLPERLERLESELAIRNLIARYGMAVDCGDGEAAAALHTADCVYEVAAPGTGRDDADRHQQASLVMKGRQAIRDMVSGAGHQALLPNCAHTTGPLEVSVSGDSARAMGYSRLYHDEGGVTRLMRLGFNCWQLQKLGQDWRIARRTSCPVGSEAAQQLLRDGPGGGQMKRLDGGDAVFLYTESATQYTHSLKVAVFEPAENGEPYSFDRQFDHIASTIHRVPPFRWKAVPTPLNIHHPVWVADPDFDLALHVHRAALPAPGGEKELCEFVENIASTPLNRDRALWELWMVEGYRGDRVAAVYKVHHALADGAATAEILEDLMTRKPGEDITGTAPFSGDPLPSRAYLAGWALKDLLRDLLRIPAQVMRMRAAKKRYEDRSLPPGERPVGAFACPFTVLNKPISSHRKFAFFTLELDDARLIRRAFDTTINDVVLNLCAQAVREYLDDRDVLPDEPLTAVVPISTRPAEQVHTYGNQVGSLHVSLCTDIEDPIERLTAIHRSMQAARLEFEDTRGARVNDLLRLLPPIAARSLASYSRRRSEQGKPPAVNLIVSNVPGPREQLYEDRMPLGQFYSIGPVLEGCGLNITAWSFRDNLSFSILSCSRVVPDPGEIGKSLVAAMDTMKKAAQDKTSLPDNHGVNTDE